MFRESLRKTVRVSPVLLSLLIAGVFAQSGLAESADASLKEQGAQYCQAFAKGDVDKLLSFWDDAAIYVDQFGNIYKSKNEIKKQYESFFNKYGIQPLEINPDSVSFPREDLAIETGISRLTNSSAPSATARYLATHIKRDGKWLVQSVSESPYKAESNGEYLKPLNWLLGSWKASNSAGGSLDLSLTWANNNVIAREASVTNKDGSKMKQTEYIYWNPQNQQISSWQFDANGGTSHAWWERNADSWVVHANSVQADGSRARADYVLKPDGNDSFTWQSKNRNLAGVDLPDTDQVKVTRVKS